MLLDEHTSTQEKKLYEALLALEEGADLAEYMATRIRFEQREQFMEEAAQLRRHAQGIRDMIESRGMPPVGPNQ